MIVLVFLLWMMTAILFLTNPKIKKLDGEVLLPFMAVVED